MARARPVHLREYQRINAPEAAATAGDLEASAEGSAAVEAAEEAATAEQLAPAVQAVQAEEWAAAGTDWVDSAAGD